MQQLQLAQSEHLQAPASQVHLVAQVHLVQVQEAEGVLAQTHLDVEEQEQAIVI